MKKIIAAEIRQLVGAQVLTLVLAATLLVIVWTVSREASTNAKPAGVILNYLASFVVTAAPALFWWYNDLRVVSPGRYALLDTLPLSRLRLNLTRLLAGVLLLWPALLAWIPIFILLDAVYYRVSLWVGVFAFVLLVDVMIISLRTVAAIVFPYAVLPLALAALYFVPGAEFLVDTPVRWINTPWASLALAAQTVALGWWVIRMAPRN